MTALQSDLTFSRSGELQVTQVEGNTEEGVEFIDGWFPTADKRFMVVDSGRVIVPTTTAPSLEEAAKRDGLTVEHEVVL